MAFCHFLINPDSVWVHVGKIHARRRPQERYHQDCNVERHIARTPGSMVWGGISYESMTPLVFIQNTITVQLQITDMLKPVVSSFLGSKLIMPFFEKMIPDHIQPTSHKPSFKLLTSFPGCSPDLFPIEHVWEIMGKKCWQYSQPNKLQQLGQKIDMAWSSIPQEAIKTVPFKFNSENEIIINIVVSQLYDVKENPKVEIEKGFNSPGLTVWGGICSEGIRGLQIFDEKVNGENNLKILKEFMQLKLVKGLPAHYSNIYRTFLNERFPYKLMGRCGPIDWPARSPDLTPARFLLGYLKYKVYHRISNLRMLIYELVFVKVSLKDLDCVWKQIEDISINCGMVACEERSNSCWKQALLFERRAWPESPGCRLRMRINYEFTKILADDLKWRAVGKIEAGQSQVEVAKWLNVNKSVVSKIWKQFIETGTIKRKEGSGRKRKTATSEDLYLVVTAKRHREMTAIQLSNELSSATGTRISRQTVYRRLHEGALYARRPMVCIPLTSAHRRARLNWCLEHHA
ncbi:hypothetical protein LAZ67_10000920 [Cordylochernes scorpioides]|uniref:Transposase Tc1-like domain-containing protein n=1 Tax=Cordylochernes scorpioides TaxID=51811 RepID=A0ABY6KVE2_9ARAC|nr:hypothetical protein LAZ67_10000920 [Cordylochernes scorpioides]